MHPFSIKNFVTILFGLLCLVSAQAKTQSLIMGVFPYFDPATIASLHQPLAEQLAQGSGESVRLVSAPNFKAFKKRTAEGRYDILVTAPHLGRIAEKKHGYQWLAFTANHSHAVFVARKDSGIDNIAQLRGKTLALPPVPAIIHQLALVEVQKAGLTPGKDVQVKTLNSHNNALLTALRGDTDAAAFGLPTWKRYQAPGKAQLKMIGASEDIPGFAIMLHPRVADDIKARLHEALFDFPSHAEGMAYFDRTGLLGVREPQASDMQQLDAYLQRIAKAMAKKR